MPKDNGKDLAADALVKAGEVEIMAPEILKQAQLGLDPNKYFAREQVGKALLGHTLGLTVASNLKMRENLERASDTLVADIVDRPIPENEELACKVMSLKIRAASGLAILSARHISLTMELTNLAELQGRVNLKGAAKSLAPQTFVGTNFVQINGNQPTVASEPKPVEDDSDKTTNL
jgi:hypothetical protein